MNRNDAFEIGIIVKTRGISGEVILETKDASIQENIKESILIEIDGLLVPFFISQMHNVSNNRVRITLDWIDNEKKASKLVKCCAYLESNQIVKRENNEPLSPAFLEGFTAIDINRGQIGIVQEYIPNKNNPLLAIKNQENEILIPFQNSLIKGIDPDNRTITFETPEGLIDIYLEDKQWD